jgi:hypothetical protein
MTMPLTLKNRFRHVCWSLVVPFGLSVSVFTLGYGYTYCLDGSAYGTPFPVLRPSHYGSTLTSVFVGEIAGVPSEVFLPGVLANTVFWALSGAMLLAILPRPVYRVLFGEMSPKG